MAVVAEALSKWLALPHRLRFPDLQSLQPLQLSCDCALCLVNLHFESLEDLVGISSCGPISPPG